MKPVKKNAKLKVSSEKIEVAPPKGYHWMEEKGRYYLMEGEYKPHPGAIEKALFKTTTHPK
jgi:hypothetical protein|tara:strand:+ start:3349 stop:3531 length:183 start_codon:yes stop_codon:yes gene_type:complete